MAELFISYGSVGLSTAKEHKPCTRLTALRHNHRELQAELGCAGDIDASRCHLNIVLAGHTSAGECEAHALALFNGAKLKRNHMQALEIVFSLPHDTGIDVREYFGACLAWAKTYHALPVLSAVVHLDQAKPHMHLLLLPIDGNGEYMRGVNPSKVEVRQATESFAQRVALPFGLQGYNVLVRSWGEKQESLPFRPCTTPVPGCSQRWQACGHSGRLSPKTRGSGLMTLALM